MFTKLHEYLAEYKQAQAEGNQAEMHKQRFPRAACTWGASQIWSMYFEKFVDDCDFY